MKNNKQYDFTQGSIAKQLFYFSGPILLANLLQTSYQFIDSLWVGNLLGSSALGAVAISGSILFVVLSFIIGMNNAALTILSQQKGKQNEKGLRNYLNAFVVLLTLISIFLGVIGYIFAEQFLGLLGTPQTMMEDASTYLRINFMGIWFLFGYNFISTVLRSLGDSKTPLYFITIAVGLNILLDPLFISVFNWGIEGAAYATLLSQAFSFLCGISYVLWKKLAPFSLPALPAREEIKLILHLGIPSGLQMAVISAGSAAIMSVVTTHGESVIAGFGAAQRLDSLLMLPAHALSTSVASMAGQNIGIKNWERIRQIAIYGVIYNFAIMLIIGIAVAVFAQYGVRLFIRESDAVDFGTVYLQIVALCYPFLGINFILNGIVRAAGAMYQVLILNVISFWILRYPLTALFSSWFGEVGIAIGMGGSFVLSSLFAIFYYRYGKWRQKELFAN
ncbi:MULTISPECIES: MATE family efflux transporter [Oceanobacillus]|uniref:Multidrug resistance protein YpnP n=1 Tax=Oceanobacillus kimchii TaxID=746691 RepID=A0ABQ5TPL4_9BACI|nr:MULTISPECIES: MATE family efflux transporter [Oceanobacillus]MBT2599528.1 MATE family efflux transporter [Oceanobacillus sp. ISL-74]GLO67751.1 putative multidrug resistance protein YpnP [Oceanobacillus kimchii]